MRRSIVVLCVALAATAGVAAETAGTAWSGPPATVEDAAWLEGYWEGTGFGSNAEEIWSAPAADTIVGSFRLHKDGKVSFYELFALVEESGSLVIVLKHFSPDMTGWEEKNEVIRFPLLEITPNKLVFDGLTYERLDADNLRVTVRVAKNDGEPVTEVFNYRRRPGK